MREAPTAHYADDSRLAARQRLWRESRRDPPFDLILWVLDRAGLTAGSALDVLDVGCGNGAYLGALAARGHAGRRVGGDLSHGMLTTIVRGEAVVQLDAQALPIADESFDVVLAPHMLYHVPERRQAALELRRVLRPGGRLVAVTNGPGNLAELKRMAEDAVGGGWRLTMPHEEIFGLHNGAAQLAVAFDHVELVRCPDSPLVVGDADLLADYVASVGDFYQDQVDVPWDEVVERVRASARALIEREGEVRLSNEVGAFVCR
jgi:SAM-dependent methyltransferase